MPIRATTDLGCRKCVPLKVDRKLYSASTFVRFAISTDAVYRRVPSRCSRLSVPFHAVRIVIVILRAREWAISALRERDQLRRDHALFAARAGAIGDRVRHCGERSVAGHANRYLLIGRERQRSARIGYSADHKSAIVTVRQGDPLRVLWSLVPEIHGRLERLIVVDPEHPAG